jgi:decaprenylphospho-beta-D-erythro-pentofuranosid-2-ulose 2-reductase
MQDTILILGARSDIAMAVAHRFASEGYNVQLAARNVDTLASDKSDLELRYSVSVSLHEFDALCVKSHFGFVEDLPHLPSVAFCAVGVLGNQLLSEADVNAATIVIRSNFEGPASILAALANKFEHRGSGCLVGVSSVAGERGRAINYVYGSAKAGFTAFLSGLRNRLARKGVHVITILPGFVATKMTEDLNLTPMLTAYPEAIAEAIYNGVKLRKDVIYYKWTWQLIMFIIRHIPETIFKKSSI